MIFALAGNQNSGKTTLFNALTGSNQHVGNFPGVTVEQKIGVVKYAKECSVVDLPGIYSIRSYTPEEILARDFILNEKPAAIINIVDATNIERNLYLTLQLLTLRTPMVVALNMMDEVYKNGGSINTTKLSEALGVPVVPISAIKREGLTELIDRTIETAQNKTSPKVYDFCHDGPVHRCIHSLTHVIEDHADKIGFSARFCAIKMIEGDAEFIERLKLDKNELELLEHSIVEMETESGFDRNEALADMRYSFIENVVAAAVKKPNENRDHLRSVKIDKILTGKYTAIPLFLLIMFAVFYFSFIIFDSRVSELLTGAIEYITEYVNTCLVDYKLNPVVRSLIIDGVFTGVGSVLSFLPIIIVLFFFLSILEDTGYMARVAFIMDKPFRKIGLSGRSFVPMLLGFGCTVPAVMATRTLFSNRDRKMTILLTPYMSCSAKIPIYVLFTAAFFQRHESLFMVGLYAFGILLGILASVLLKHTVFKGEPVPFVMELPNYRLPSVRNVFLLLWQRAKEFIVRAFTLIFAATIVIWFFQTFDSRLNVVQDSEQSLLASVGRFIAPVLKPMGCNDWRIATSLITGFTAKEAVVSTLSVLLKTGEAELTKVLSGLFTPISAVSFLIFTLLYTPCVAAVAAIHRELKSKLQTLIVVFMQCFAAWVVAVIVFQVLSRVFA